VIQLFHGDCLVEMDKIPDKSVDLILCDLPFETTPCKWDVLIPFDALWKQYWRVLKQNGVIVLFGFQPFTSKLISSQIESFKYCWIWNKAKASNFFCAKLQPLNNTEDICVFSKGGCNIMSKQPMRYFPQGVVATNEKIINRKGLGGLMGKEHQVNLAAGSDYIRTVTNYPFKTLSFTRDRKIVHPCQKPIALLEYLINTYTLEGEMVLDNCMGGGSAGIAALNTKRDFIGIEKDNKYFEIAQKRILEAS
jgi:site-specific DNA-methyltransferase (adenine-specific)